MAQDSTDKYLVGGPGRIPSARNQSAARQAPQAQALPIRSNTGSSSQYEPQPAAAPYPQGSAAGNAQETEGYMAYMQRQMNERTAKIGTVDENMQSLSTASAQWAEGVGSFVAKQKRNLVMGAVKSRFGI